MPSPNMCQALDNTKDEKIPAHGGYLSETQKMLATSAVDQPAEAHAQGGNDRDQYDAHHQINDGVSKVVLEVSQ